jgi:hypothetical protein
MIEPLVQEIFTIIFGVALGIAGVGPLSSVLTSALKRLDVLSSVPAANINAGSIIIVFLVAAVADHYGHLEQFSLVSENVAAILGTIFAGTLSSHAAYEAANRHGVAVWGHARTRRSVAELIAVELDLEHDEDDEPVEATE